ncbi:hypothetical protein WS83_18165 [Burkholderia sp. MSMB2042]|nr:hypothetical protein WS78_31915 [Burkholderia savannae]KVG41394.1 hypothetical protein WS77_17275 [Burkholderia sp. MSMB0265]KVG87913.1 hypothetical protein WS81_25610 [Burkholderia sp. MSMB2040]KVG96484.1 hypothetical protein WS82_32110 [Burkholderia sp. MSMB2041]KVH01631.1 hypothetical protein WS83_18165 [Burkholderia sp. MSMB2042]
MTGDAACGDAIGDRSGLSCSGVGGSGQCVNADSGDSRDGEDIASGDGGVRGDDAFDGCGEGDSTET